VGAATQDSGGASLPTAGTAVPLFEFDEVTVGLGGTRVLDALDLRVPAAGVTAVLGRSGSGKSTLTRLCNRLLDPSSGVVRFRGIDARDLDVLALRRSVGMVFQRPTAFPGRVADNMAATGVLDPRRHGAVLDRVGLDPGLLEQDASTLSGGESQRMCLARALLMEPDVLVADEPTAALDEPGTRALEELVCAAASRGVPVLWVTHDLAQFDRIADHGVVLAGGRVVASGSVQVLREVSGGVRALLESNGLARAPHHLRALPEEA